MNHRPSPATGVPPEALIAVADLYHAWFTGLLLTVVSRRGRADAAELVFRVFRRQQLERFLSGLDKLGLRGLPDAVACAQYHYFSNQVGGVGVEYVPEADRKAWIRYPPPRWIWAGTAICGIPSEVSRAMLRGWHANNGVLLGNPRLGFVCTKQTVDGQPGLEGYYLEHDRELDPEERLRFSPGEEAPPFDPDLAPRLESEAWPEERLRKVYRSYAMDYLRTALPVVVELFGPTEGAHLAGLAARLIGMQHHDRVLAAPDGGDGAPPLLDALATLLAAEGDEVEVIERAADGETGRLRLGALRLMRGVAHPPREVIDVWGELWRGLAIGRDRFCEVAVEEADGGGAVLTVSSRRPASG